MQVYNTILRSIPIDKRPQLQLELLDLQTIYDYTGFFPEISAKRLLIDYIIVSEVIFVCNFKLKEIHVKDSQLTPYCVKWLSMSTLMHDL